MLAVTSFSVKQIPLLQLVVVLVFSNFNLIYLRTKQPMFARGLRGDVFGIYEKAKKYLVVTNAPGGCSLSLPEMGIGRIQEARRNATTFCRQTFFR